ncbi:MAG: SIR2 family protein [Ardenticatenaceae bacterium]|nr:SIR2 family protein [Anaerolineales bacterium]MCB8920138.1 SIR2 family protein [Ardenticatenaceae bacterium]MCB8992200.1 SIR2 family protein [Ardenticatenaceae bacterium]MCB9005069.1 SIR2 family protein [Ardenticatenaceae bacterium]
MTRFKIQKATTTKKGWKESLIDRINEGKALPVISYVVGSNLVFDDQNELMEGWAYYTEYPGPERNLARMAQYQAVMAQAEGQDSEYVKRDYLKFLKAALQSIADEDLVEDLQEEIDADKLTFSETADRLGFPKFDDGLNNPLLILAKLPLPIYLTTSYHTFLEMALRREGKQPRTEICYWNNQLSRIPSNFDDDNTYHPTIEEPLVYHLHGLDAHPASLVLTEDDHLDFLVNTARDWEGIPLIIRQALTDSALMLLGFGLAHWDFRTVFRGLIRASLAERRPKSVAIQLQGDDHQQNYLKNYLDQEGKFEVYWGDAPGFMQEIWQVWAS